MSRELVVEVIKWSVDRFYEILSKVINLSCSLTSIIVEILWYNIYKFFVTILPILFDSFGVFGFPIVIMIAGIFIKHLIFKYRLNGIFADMHTCFKAAVKFIMYIYANITSEVHQPKPENPTRDIQEFRQRHNNERAAAAQLSDRAVLCFFCQNAGSFHLFFQIGICKKCVSILFFISLVYYFVILP